MIEDNQFSSQRHGKETLTVHAGGREAGGGVVNAIELSSAFHHIDQGETTYPRYFNTANQQIIVDKLCALEKAETGLVFSSGMAAISTTLASLLRRGDHVLMQAGVYGGTRAFAANEFEKLGMTATLVDAPAAPWDSELRENTRLIYLESPNNPLLEIIDLQQIADVARSRNIITLTDNTFASPINQNPIDLGIDLVVHSGTKYLGGHSDLTFGVVVGAKSRVEQIRAKAKLYGGNTNALTCYLMERSLKTLALRVEAQNRNAMSIAKYLAGKSIVNTVNYPGLQNHPNHQVAARQMTGFGGMLSFELPSEKAATDFLRQLKLIIPAVSLGGVETLVSLPMHTSHATISQEQRRACRITDGLVRLSAGIETTDDLIADLEQALRTIDGNRG